MIGVIGATGNVGSVLTQKLVQTGEEVVAVSHGGPEAPSVRNVRADITQPQTIEAALHGANAVFLLVAVEAHDGIDPDALIQAIERTGAARIVLLSSMGTVSRPQARGYESLRHVEAAVRRSKLEVTILRPTGFASNTFAWAPSVRAKREVAAPFGDIGIPIVDPADIAEVAAVALRGGHAGAIYDLTGPEPITPRAQARDLGEALGVSLKFTEIGRADAVRLMVEHMPADMAEATLDIAGTPNEIERRVSPDIERVLRRPAAPYAAWVRRNIAAFRS
jgi:uncharacterized protein YbjT (DUF2867 family)